MHVYDLLIYTYNVLNDMYVISTNDSKKITYIYIEMILSVMILLTGDS